MQHRRIGNRAVPLTERLASVRYPGYLGMRAGESYRVSYDVQVVVLGDVER